MTRARIEDHITRLSDLTRRLAMLGSVLGLDDSKK